MSCLGVTGKPMVVTVKCGVESDFESEMEEYCITHEHTWVGVGILRMDFPAIWLLHGPCTMGRTLRGSC